MPDSPPTRALTVRDGPSLSRGAVAFAQVDLQAVAQHMYALMLRNVASDGFVLTDSSHTIVSRPGCVIAAPSYPGDTPGISQDYVFHWTRDAAIVATELVVAVPPDAASPVQSLNDYVAFAQVCWDDATPTKGHACFRIDGTSRPWTEQNDGPALQALAALAAYDKLDATTQETARTLVGQSVDYLLTCYQDATTNLWEEHVGHSFFARSTQLRCLREVAANPFGIPVPPGTDEAITWLEAALATHWDGTRYLTMVDTSAPGEPPRSVVPADYDPNIDIVQACVYGAVPTTDTRMLATAAQLIAQWADAGSPEVYPVNVADADLGVGPLLGRYPGDLYDGAADSLGRHPWPLCTANVAQLHYELAASVRDTGSVPLDALSRPFFDRIGIEESTAAEAATALLRDAGDAMLRAVIRHSDHLELSEQFDGTTGYEKSVRDLTWSYAAFLSAVRARDGQSVRG